jgi:hypothetical protein
MSLSFINTCDEPLVGPALDKFLEGLKWGDHCGSPMVFKDGEVEYMGHRRKYEIVEGGRFHEFAVTNKDPNCSAPRMVMAWKGNFIAFEVSGKIVNYQPVVHNGKYYLYNRCGGLVVAEGFIPPTGPCCSICFEQPANCAAVPCGHKCGCYGCLQEVMNRDGRCPICRADMKDVVRIYETETEAPNYAAAVVKTIPKTYNISDMTEFPPLPQPEFEVNNLNSTFCVIDGGQRRVYTWLDLLNKYNKNSKNVVMWKLLNGDEQHGRVCNIYNKVYMCAMDKYPMYFDFSMSRQPLKPLQPLKTPLKPSEKQQLLKVQQQLETSRQELLKAQQQLHQQLDYMPQPTGRFSEDGKLLFNKPPKPPKPPKSMFKNRETARQLNEALAKIKTRKAAAGTPHTYSSPNKI